MFIPNNRKVKLMRLKKTITIISSFLIIGILGLGIGIYIDDRTVNYAQTSSQIPSKRQQKPCCSSINLTGIENIKVHASGLVNFPHFLSTVKWDKDNLYVVNLLPEDTYYYNGRNLRWFGLGYTPQDLGEELFTHRVMKSAYKTLLRTIYGVPAPITKGMPNLKTEEEIVRGLGGNYYAPLKGNPNWLSDQSYMEGLIHFFETLPKDAVLYIHCAHGKGRTTTFLVLYDIFKNAKKVSLEDIVNRHYCLGRENILDTKVRKDGTWTGDSLKARRSLVERFHLYMSSSDGYGQQSWSQWNKIKGYAEPVEVKIHR